MHDVDDDQAERVFLGALERRPEERDALLDEVCGGDAALKARVSVLLEAHEQAGTFLEVSPTTTAPPANGDVAGHRIGHYTVRRVIASGGMGVVYEAVQEHPHRTVALKVLRAGIASPSALRRFSYESQILARLRHPNIAQVFEAGTHEEPAAPGQATPYFAMEYVPNARTLIEYAAEKKLATRERLQLFARVCEATQHGHQKGIIHRDLKPANILVDDSGRPRVLDFGVARATDADMAVTTLQTDVGQLIGTLQYMSPEQCEADPHDLDSRSDVYALGLVLYEMLCGRPPYELAHAGVHEAVQAIRDATPPRPSTVDRSLRGDLETITLKALEKDRSRRYQSAGDLAADIHRYLNDEPIVARPPSALYHLRKFVTRNKTLTSGLALTAAALVLGALVATWQAARAQNEASRALSIKQFLVETLGATDFVEAGRRVTVVGVLDRAADGIAGSFADRPEIEAEIRHILGLSYASMSELGKAAAQLQRALEIRNNSLGPEHPTTLETAHSLGRALFENKQIEEAEELMRTVVEARARTLGEHHPDTLWSLARLAMVLDWRHEYEEAEAEARRAVAGLTRALGEGDERTLRARLSWSTTLEHGGRPVEAEAEARRTLETSSRALGEDHWVTLMAGNKLGSRLYVQGRWEEAEPLLRSALDSYRRRFGEEDYVALTWMEQFGWALYREGQKQEGELLLRRAVDGLRRVLGESNLATAYAMTRLWDIEQDLGNLEQAEALLRQSLNIKREILGDGNPYTLEHVNLLAWFLKDRGTDKLKEAESLASEALARCRSTLGEGDRMTFMAADTLAVVLHMQDRNEEAVAAFESLAVVARRVLGGDRWFTVLSCREYASALVELMRFGDAESMLLELHEVLMSTTPERDSLAPMGEYHECTLDAVRMMLIELYEAWGKPVKAGVYRALVREMEGTDEASE